MQQTLTQIVKRDGTIVPFNENNIRNALVLCFSAIGKEPSSGFDELVSRVCAAVKAKHGTSDLVTVESVQDCVEYVLQADNEFEASKAYILFRAERNRVRTNNNEYIPFEVQKVFDDSAKYFPTQLQQFQFFDKYSKYNYDLGRRETWIETVDRVVSFLHELASPYADLGGETYRRIRQAVLDFRVMPSMRLMAMAGPAARRDNLTIYNCSYLPVDSLSSFEEALHISMAGCGVGFSVESREVLKLPEIAKQRGRYKDTYVIEDTAEGWADALMYGLSTWFDGEDVLFDYSNIRLAGVPLRTKGGRASGPEPLMAFLEFARKRILAKQGTRLSTLDAHDIMCAVGSAAVAGGVRRTAMISIFDMDDYDMLHCKDGDFAVENKQRWNANNSVVIERNLSQQEMLNLVHTMTKDNRGEPGIFSRINAQNTAPERRVTDGVLFGTNPCGEINLNPRQLCNLSAAINGQDVSPDQLIEAVEIATIIGTIQSLATYFPNLSRTWKDNCERERLLGVDITGQRDNVSNLKPVMMQYLQATAIDINKQVADTLGINQSASITCVKPSGNTSVLVDCSSGLHARWAKYYIKNIRASVTSPLVRAMKDAGMPMSYENGGDKNTVVIPFVIKSPDGAITRHDLTALDQLEWWAQNKIYYTEHNPSVSITYKPDEVIDVAKWLYDHQDILGGISIFPAYDGNYEQLPWVEISEEEYNKRKAQIPEINWANVYLYEKSDMTTAAQEVACTAGVCEL